MWPCGPRIQDLCWGGMTGLQPTRTFLIATLSPVMVFFAAQTRLGGEGESVSASPSEQRQHDAPVGPLTQLLDELVGLVDVEGLS